ncbi:MULTISPECIES: DUF1993 domain-containing protein [Burkholderia]|uniref:DUF1993 domain-containing protein n=1 Tax=Burkholderia savannae TaxID=1637837 RepID=A0ABR5TCP9_9BURK|nr:MULTISPECIES: DUF1993 domain-containing protein [Burkholderia]AOJ68541.1 hypothetical protein WS78_07065 [Burkholderia savannae]AOJ80543.1 hypothetical protein WS86_07890 [Burkholderia savannae]AOK46762.1 hypothetical protein WT60_07825 [Burkholderia sp. MSMB617WGS]KGS04927.1 hypothetical protein X946_2532 [Burkholderia sp. ABCPW 111]KVG46704.1 hypothetical protein WS77_30445 [Burkholderia sp. MSMB0265]
MALSMYDVSIPAFIRGLNNLSAVLDKGDAYARSQGVEPAEFVRARLRDDMYSLDAQVQRASDTAKGCGARLAGIAVPSFADTEATFAELRARIGKTIDFLKTIQPAQLDGSETRAIELPLRDGVMTFDGKSYLLGFALPNFYFHTTTAYDILRHKGVPLGKMDYLGGR